MKLINKSNSPKIPYTILNEAGIRHRQNEQISHVTSVLSLSKPEACLLLCHYKWNTLQLYRDWFANESSVRNKVGLLVHDKVKSTKVSNTNDSRCGICFKDNLSIDQVYSASCDDHYYCKTCWSIYIGKAISNSGLGCLSLRCPYPSCAAFIGQNMIYEIAAKKDKQNYASYFIRSYVEGKKSNIKWCPAPGCDRAVELEHGGGISGYDVVCDCSHRFCWNCGEEPHRPVECKAAAEWLAEAGNTKWILTYTKPCPKCKRPIEKSYGCDHMTCSAPCRHQFCWLCLGDWKTPNRGNHLHNCNINDEQTQRKLAPLYNLSRHTEYYELWLTNDKSRQKAIEDMHKFQITQLPKLCDRVSKPVTQLEFIVQAWKQIIECWQVIKWTCVYGYFSPKQEYFKRQLFRHMQRKAEDRLKRLHNCAKIELAEKFLATDGGTEANFTKFRKKLIKLTKVTGGCFENLVSVFENGYLEEMGFEGFSKGKSSFGVLSSIKLQAFMFLNCYSL